MDGMIGGMDGGSDTQTPLSSQGVDFNNATQASDFLDELLDDSIFQPQSALYAQYFWYGVVVAIALAAMVNVLRLTTLALRKRSAARGDQDTAKPKNVFMRWTATVTAMAREITYAQITPTNHPFQFKIPPIGTILLIAGYTGFVLALEFINSDVQGAQYYTALSIRAGWLAVAQLPLQILLIGKVNWIGIVTGISYERLNVLHRWTSRMLLLLATFHFGFNVYGWSEFPNIFSLEWVTDSCVPTGLATYVILIWMNLSTLAPIRNLCYEFFVIQHILTFFGFIIAVMFHLPAYTARVYVYIPIGFYLFDRLIRGLRYAFINRNLSRATLTAMDGGVTKIQLRNPHVKAWRPGAHVLISIPALGFGQNHPATIASTPKSHNGDIVLMLKSQGGFTKSILERASRSETSLLLVDSTEAPESKRPVSRNYAALVDGPYGGKHADFAAFDSVCLFAGSTGITFILPILLDIADQAERTKGKLPLRRVSVTWCIKEFGHAKWVHSELVSVFEKLRLAGIETDIGFYVTCADSYTTAGNSKECPCECDKSLGPCCCINPEDIARENEILQPLMGGPQKASRTTEKKAVNVTTESLASDDVASPALTRAVLNTGRPLVSETLKRVVESASGETGIAVCGPLGMSASVRNAVVQLSDQRAVHKGTGAQGIYLHVEGFGL